MNPEKTSTIGILGGSFDPVHNGHLTIARNALEFFALDAVFFIPANIQPLKEPLHSSAADRMAMLLLALKNEPRFVAMDVETRRGGISYSVDTVSLLQKEYPQSGVFFIIGADNLASILAWHKVHELVAMVTFCITDRPGYANTIPAELAGADIRLFPSPPCDISSTAIRRRVQSGQSCGGLIPDAVQAYIKKRALYVPPYR
jgi:nicotinate-nucleotide adenylyltransferase